MNGVKIHNNQWGRKWNKLKGNRSRLIWCKKWKIIDEKAHNEGDKSRTKKWKSSESKRRKGSGKGVKSHWKKELRTMDSIM